MLCRGRKIVSKIYALSSADCWYQRGTGADLGRTLKIFGDIAVHFILGRYICIGERRKNQEGFDET